MGLLGAYDETKGRWSVQLPERGKVWIKGENLWAVDGLKARITLAEHILDGKSPGMM